MTKMLTMERGEERDRRRAHFSSTEHKCPEKSLNLDGTKTQSIWYRFRFEDADLV